MHTIAECVRARIATLSLAGCIVAGCIVAGCSVVGTSGCARSPEEEVVGLVRRLGGRADSIRRIDLAHTATTDADLARLVAIGGEPLAGVEELDLTHTAVTDAGVTALPRPRRDARLRPWAQPFQPRSGPLPGVAPR